MSSLQRAMVFHHPLPIELEGTSGSRVRPRQMVRAFEEIGYSVDVVAGYGAQRQDAARRVLRELERDRSKYDFVYSESSTQPTLLTERHHLPTRPFLDFGFLRAFKQSEIPVGLFYRDVYWRTELYAKQVPPHKRIGAVLMYRYDLYQYRRSIHHLFLPDLAMQRLLPRPWPEGAVSSLPPGCYIQPLNDAALPDIRKGVKLLYVGGIAPPLYDLASAIQAVGNSKDTQLTICCRPEEWNQFSDHYQPLPSNVTVVHMAGSQLRSLYETHHAALIVHNHWYHTVTLPVKYFESVGYGRPTIAIGDSVLIRSIRGDGSNWDLKSEEELTNLLATLQREPAEYEAKLRALYAKQDKNTWTSRARQAASVLEGYRKPSSSSTDAVRIDSQQEDL